MNHLGLIGYPLAHSFSPAYFKDKFQREGLADYRYEAFPLSSIELLSELLAQHPDLSGFNVTIPYKEQILPYLDEMDEAAGQVGAVNCVKILRGKDIRHTQFVHTRGCEKNYWLKGYNTDAPAFEHCLKEGWQLPNKALIFGTGGAAKAVAYALQRLHIDFYFVSRSKQDKQTLTYRDLKYNILKDYKLWINTTPVGMYPHTEETLSIDFSIIGNKHYLFDLIYNPEATAFLQQGQLHGAHTKNGISMLHEQAELSWQIFNNLSDY